jgi:hypothetical protein
MLTITSPREDHANPAITPALAATEAQEHLEHCENVLTDRPDVLQAIAFHETRLLELRQKLPTAIKLFYRYRCKPEQFVWVYASSREQADQRLHARMRKSYGDSWSIAVNVVDVFADPENAAANSPGSLFRSLTDAEAREFLADYRADQRGRVEKSKLKHVGKSQLEHDAEAFEKYLLQQER